MINQTQILARFLQGQEHEWLLTRIEKSLLEFQEIIRRNKPVDFQIVFPVLENFLGFGEGSTPQSDDVFLGIIATISSKEPELGQKLSSLTTIPFEKFTSRTSSSLIRSFLRNNHPSELYQFIKLLKLDDLPSSQLSKYEWELRRIKSIGASSGLYFLVGVLWQLNYYENQREGM